MAFKSGRNRDILAAYETGQTLEQLSQEYGLSASSVKAILTQERQKRRVSPDPFYRALRKS